jgi:hypothetical protein
LRAGEIMPDGRADGGIKVTEHREPPRPVSSDRPFDGAADHPGKRFRLRRFDEAGNHRKIDYQRAGMLVLAGLAVLAGLLYLGDRGKRATLDWLGHQAQYQLSFDRIELAPETPRWYLGGSQAFLERVRLGAGEPENIAVLDVARDRLALAFKKYAWVEEVLKVAYPPGQIRLEIRYRQPVARVQLRGGEKKLIDRNAVILPAEDVDLAALDQVITITGDNSAGGLAAPSEPRPGVIWKSPGDQTGLIRVDERIVAASKLAAFLVQDERANDAGQYPALHMVEIIVTDFRVHTRGLFVLNAERTMIRWGDAPGDEPVGTLSAEEKWAILRQWRQKIRSRLLELGDYWSFSKRGLDHVCPHRDDSHRPKEFSERPARAPIATKEPSLSG